MSSPQNNYIIGKNSVLAVLRQTPRRVMKVFLAEGNHSDRRVQEIQDLCRNNQIAVQSISKQKIESMLNPEGRPSRHGAPSEERVNHQGILAVASPKESLTLQGFLEKFKGRGESNAPGFVIILDEVTDPRNFGAILRIADGAGALGVIIGKHRSALLTPAAVKTASGAEESVDLVVVTNLSQTLQTLKKEGFWVVGAGFGPKSQPYTKIDYNMATALVLGSEGEGLSPNLQKQCDFLAEIPMAGTVESLNVATATAILAYEIIRQQTNGASKNP